MYHKKDITGEVPAVYEQERESIKVIQNLDYGEVRVIIKGSSIVQIEEKKSIKL